uniref:BTB domain containing 19 n=1 Tax=Mus musculus TaxID=10090 RepID=A9JD57_MOUSE
MENPGLVVRGQAAPFSTALRSLINNPQYRVPQSGLKSGALGRRLWKLKRSLLPPTPT